MTAHKHISIGTFTATLALAFSSLTASATNSSHQPLSTNFAQTLSEISLDLNATSFSDVELDEADSFDGWSAALELTVPFNDTMQLRFSLPFYTDGEATLTDPSLPDVGEKTDITGNGGVFDFMTLSFEHQLSSVETSGYNAGYSIGFGQITDQLETDTSDDDLYNHTGRVIVAAINMDKPIFDGKSQWLINAGVRYYFDTDDLHPDGRADFTWADIKTAVIFQPWALGKLQMQPVLELTYLGEFSNYNALALMPELIFPFGKSASFKLGGIIGLTNDGNQGGVVGELSIGF